MLDKFFRMRIILQLLGWISLLLGVIGIFLPVLPTTPFILLSAALFAKSSKRWHDYLLNHRFFGEMIRDFEKDKSISLKVKVIAISMLWLAILSSAFLVLQHKLYLQILLLAIATFVTIYILSFKTKKG